MNEERETSTMVADTDRGTSRAAIRPNRRPSRQNAKGPRALGPAAGRDVPRSADASLIRLCLDKIILFLSSLRLTIVLLALGMVLVFAGTIAQADLGLYKAQNDYFRSF